mmetsp:Transcript_16081/g.60851  ORF Transcript_16081/g.60851 Transcript_16081/m.60851 type:complete len:383 (+) Transcript_16081:268-1416(+)
MSSWRARCSAEATLSHSSAACAATAACSSSSLEALPRVQPSTMPMYARACSSSTPASCRSTLCLASTSRGTALSRAYGMRTASDVRRSAASSLTALDARARLALPGVGDMPASSEAAGLSGDAGGVPGSRGGMARTRRPRRRFSVCEMAPEAPRRAEARTLRLGFGVDDPASCPGSPARRPVQHAHLLRRPVRTPAVAMTRRARARSLPQVASGPLARPARLGTKTERKPGSSQAADPSGHASALDASPSPSSVKSSAASAIGPSMSQSLKSSTRPERGHTHSMMTDDPTRARAKRRRWAFCGRRECGVGSSTKFANSDSTPPPHPLMIPHTQPRTGDGAVPGCAKWPREWSSTLPTPRFPMPFASEMDSNTTQARLTQGTL